MIIERFKNLRISKQLSQRELASVLGFTQQAIAKWEKGVAEPDNATLSRIANYFGVTVDYLLGRSDEPYMYPVPPELSLRGITDEEEINRRVSALAAMHHEDIKKEPAPNGDELDDPLDAQLMELLRRMTPDQKKWLLEKIDTLLELQ